MNNLCSSHVLQREPCMSPTVAKSDEGPHTQCQLLDQLSIIPLIEAGDKHRQSGRGVWLSGGGMHGSVNQALHLASTLVSSWLQAAIGVRDLTHKCLALVVGQEKILGILEIPRGLFRLAAHDGMHPPKLGQGGHLLGKHTMARWHSGIEEGCEPHGMLRKHHP